ncbi:MAG: hypothetical protein ACOX9C_01330 [Kiritimatiellia bacterium]|jgi:hypothetical protein
MKKQWVYAGVAMTLGLAGCTSIYWDKNYTYEETKRKVPRTQTLRITSDPASSLAVNSRDMGKTPRSVDFSYSADEVWFARHQYERKFLGKPRIVNTDRKVESVNNSVAYWLRFEAPGYDVVEKPLVVPLSSNAFSASLPKAKVYWEQDKRFRGIQRNQPRTQDLSIKSSPPALLHVDGEVVGNTPYAATFQYAADELLLVHQRYEDAQGKAKALLEEEKTKDEFVKTKSHILKFQAPGYYDLYYPLTIPSNDAEINVTLEKAGVVQSPRCSVHVEAREAYFPEIEEALKSFSKKRPMQCAYEKPQQVTNQTYFVQEYWIHPETALEFDQMVGKMRKMAKEKQFVFDLVDTHLNAKFSTNILEPGIQHLVTAVVRPQSDLYLAQGQAITHVGNTTTNTSYTFSVRLRPEERNIYLISKYKPDNAQFPLVVYQEIDVFAQTQKELHTVEQVVEGAGVSRAKLEEKNLLKP